MKWAGDYAATGKRDGLRCNGRMKQPQTTPRPAMMAATQNATEKLCKSSVLWWTFSSPA